ncbi:CRISPR-associated endoribonuclease Cas6 [Pyrococcus kukulkanii]|uniref:CRISPR-associated endoribonuclease n=1 Tax=Pyrococcus kukulkanii TaxID=1609559 RepID=A0A127B942_9EURY|nr:CRISPR-associated endoribonuclease Cas6 [Pyrococcus kukulkanii]AMM53707.1 CRISPR-associated protein Cas6 [Pyrococcus kukulkanii]
MRLKLTLHFERPFLIPYNYPRPLYGFVINAIKLGDERIAKRLHDNKKDVKFVLSKLYPVGKARRTEKGLLVESRMVELYFGTTERAIVEALISGMTLGKGELHIAGQKLAGFSAEFMKAPKRLSGRRLRTLSPVSVYHNSPPNGFKQWDLSPIGQPNSPFENEPAVWRELVFRNLMAKYLMVYGEPYEGDFGIDVFPGSVRSKMFTIKRDKRTGKLTRVRAWEFEFRMWGDEKLLRVAYDLGLGMRNPHGFGMIGA